MLNIRALTARYGGRIATGLWPESSHLKLHAPRHSPVPRVATRLTFSASARRPYSEIEGSGACFERKSLRWHDMCIGKPAMLKAQLPRHDTDLVLAGRPEKAH